MKNTNNGIGFIAVTPDVPDIVHVSVQLTNNEDIAVSVGNECCFGKIVVSCISFKEQRLEEKYRH